MQERWHANGEAEVDDEGDDGAIVIAEDEMIEENGPIEVLAAPIVPGTIVASSIEGMYSIYQHISNVTAQSIIGGVPTCPAVVFYRSMPSVASHLLNVDRTSSFAREWHLAMMKLICKSSDANPYWTVLGPALILDETRSKAPTTVVVQLEASSSAPSSHQTAARCGISLQAWIGKIVEACRNDAQVDKLMCLWIEKAKSVMAASLTCNALIKTLSTVATNRDTLALENRVLDLKEAQVNDIDWILEKAFGCPPDATAVPESAASPITEAAKSRHIKKKVSFIASMSTLVSQLLKIDELSKKRLEPGILAKL